MKSLTSHDDKIIKIIVDLELKMKNNWNFSKQLERRL